MKIILSRKGFDDRNGGCASPIFPDGTLLSLPIPSKDSLNFSKLVYDDLSYVDLLEQLNPKGTYVGCHLDPDIREDVRIETPPGWCPAFGQINGAQGQLRNQGVGPGDLFLFFGWFRQVEMKAGKYRYNRGSPNLHAIYGYLQVGRVITDPKEIAEEYPWHPHASSSSCENKTNAIYIPRKTLSFDENRPGHGVLNFSEHRVLTLKGESRAIWREIPALMPNNIESNTERKNSAKGPGIFYNGIWQEMVLKENNISEIWAKEILQDQ